MVSASFTPGLGVFAQMGGATAGSRMGCPPSSRWHRIGARFADGSGFYYCWAGPLTKSSTADSRTDSESPSTACRPSPFAYRGSAALSSDSRSQRTYSSCRSMIASFVGSAS